MGDRKLTCVECGSRFVWTEGEQRFYRRKGLSTPKRCADCRGPRSGNQKLAGGSTRGQRGSRPVWLLPRLSRQDRLYSGAGLASAVVLAAVLAWNGLDPVVAWILAITGVTFLEYGADKALAISQQSRVSEGALLILTLAGGTLGALAGMRVFRHKTAKASFQIDLLKVVLVQVVVIAAVVLVLQALAR